MKGPADRDARDAYRAVRLAAHVAQCYPGLIDALVLDEQDADDADAVSQLGVRPVVTHTLMHDASARKRLAEAALDAVAFA